MGISNIVFIGSSDFGKTSLEKIVEGYNVTGVITETNDPCSEYAKENNIKALRIAEKHRKLKGQLRNRFIDFIEKRKPDLIVMCVWEKKIPKQIVEKYYKRLINFHGSPLPYYRGWAPINWQIIHGKKKIGMSIAFVIEKYDRGPVIARSWLQIDDKVKAGEVYDLIEPVAADMIYNTIKKLSYNRIKPQQQPQKRVYPEAPEFTEEHTMINWSSSAKQIHNLVRGCNPMAYAHTIFNREKILIAQTEPTKPTKKAEQGEIIQYKKNSFEVSCGRGNLIVKEVLSEDETPYNIQEFIKELKQHKRVILGR